MCADAACSQCGANRQIGHALHVSAAHHPLVVAGHIDEELVERNILLREGADQVAMLHPGDGQNRRPVHLGVVKSVQQMNAARARGRDTYAKPAGELCIGAGHKCSSLFVPHMDETNLVLLLAKSFKDAVDAIAGQSKYRVDSPGHQAFYQYIRCVDHDLLPQ